MKASIITIGDEILIGQIVDTNSSYIAKQLDKIGISVTEMRSVSDDKTQILETLSELQNKVEVVIITGGLGPTKDDITKKTICEYCNDVLVESEIVLQHVKELIEGFYKRPITQINRDQALVPSKAEVLFNKMGTAPGMWLQKENTVFISLPGVPYEMKYLIDNEVVPKLVQKFSRPYIIHKTIITYGRGESLIAEQIESWEDSLPSFIKLAYLPSPGRVRLRLSARGANEKELKVAIEKEVSKLQELIGDIIVGFDEDEPIEVVLGRLLTNKGLTIATAESCTGGKIAQTIASVSGASAYFKGSIVSYATDVKERILNVSHNVIEENSVVSAQVAKEMVLSVQKMMQTNIAISTTGNAGPLKGDSNAEVGIVYIGIAIDEEVFVEEFNFGQPREKVIDRAVSKALELVYKEILKK
ncbi:CinA family nicotinamide mononucleotide deamidase-related protein [Flavobacterium okayamense]|uniref:CinA-like protein n=1 Tax=Flavobacterium okayamense TaxID=2830782 RepID=A0ABM7S740_9FLAO|nr:CinA family nicotinamide mononucleotide deamidase-related protein [Flavobacterium okayamense]BCY28549.1 CinA-like protein [Flavobacterium okayamense]